MIRIESTQVTPHLETLFAADDPARLRCLAVLEGDLAGEILVDNVSNPTWSVVRESGGGTTFLSHDIDAAAIQAAFAALQKTGNIVIGLLPDDLRWKHLPCNFDRDGVNVEFEDRAAERNLGALQIAPPDCHVHPIDSAIFPRCAWHSVICRQYGTVERFLQKGAGFGLVRADEILAEAYLTPPRQGIREMAIRTQEAHRGRGYGTMLSAYSIQMAEQWGHRIYWNTALQNLASIKIARQMGFQGEREYPVKIWVALKSG